MDELFGSPSTLALCSVRNIGSIPTSRRLGDSSITTTRKAKTCISLASDSQSHMLPNDSVHFLSCIHVFAPNRLPDSPGQVHQSESHDSERRRRVPLRGIIQNWVCGVQGASSTDLHNGQDKGMNASEPIRSSSCSSIPLITHVMSSLYLPVSPTKSPTYEPLTSPNRCLVSGTPETTLIFDLPMAPYDGLRIPEKQLPFAVEFLDYPSDDLGKWIRRLVYALNDSHRRIVVPAPVPQTSTGSQLERYVDASTHELRLTGFAV